MTHIRKKFLIIICLIAIISMAAPVRAEQPTATITQLTGAAVIIAGGQERPAQTGMTVKAGEKLRTQADAAVTLTFSDGSTIPLKANTEVEIAELLQEPTTGARRSKLKLWFGWLQAKLSPGHQKEGSSFEVETPNAQVGVKFSQPEVEIWYDPRTDTTVARGYTVKLSVLNRQSGATVTEMPAAHQVIVHKQLVVVTKISDVRDVLEQMRQMPDLDAPSAPIGATPDAMNLLLETRQSAGSMTPATSRIPDAGVRPDNPENSTEPTGFTYTINIK